MKKIVSFVFAVCLLIGLVPMSASAATFSSWQKAYEDFVVNQRYLTFSGPDYSQIGYDRESFASDMAQYQGSIKHYLFDLNNDETPELLVNGLGIQQVLVFTYVNGNVAYLGNASGSIIGYDTSGKYPGLFGEWGNWSFGGYYYFTINGTTLISENVAERSNAETKRVTTDQALYNVALSASRTTSDDPFSATYDSIKGSGWGWFVSESGFQTELSKSDALKRFLASYAWYGTERTFDSTKASEIRTSNGSYDNDSNILIGLLFYGLAVDYDLYPGESRADTFNWTKPDPLNKNYNYRFREEKVNWILENIYNIPSKYISALRATVVGEGSVSATEYYLGGYYYHMGGIGGPGYDVVVDKTEPLGNYELITYRIKELAGGASYTTYYAKMKYKTIANKQYWSIYYSGTTKPSLPTQFVDVDEEAYYLDAVKWAVANNITSGTDTTHFSPNQPCTRAQAVTFLWRAAGSPEPRTTTTAFTDVKAGSYFEKAVRWAVENNVTAGTSPTTFSPNSNCTRSQIVTFMYRAAGSPSVSGGNSFSDVPFTQYYANAVAWAVANNITSGTGNGKFSPANNCTRGQIVTFLYRDLN